MMYCTTSYDLVMMLCCLPLSLRLLVGAQIIVLPNLSRISILSGSLVTQIKVHFIPLSHLLQANVGNGLWIDSFVVLHRWTSLLSKLLVRCYCPQLSSP